MAWDGNSDPEIGGYRIYSGTSSGDYQTIMDAGNNTTYTISNLLDGTTYYFTATCYSTSGEESGHSNEVMYKTPPPVCTSLSPEGQSFDSSGGTGAVSITGQAGCTWDAHANASWLIITSNSMGSGNETVNYSVSANFGTDSRSGTLTIAGKTFTANQSGVPCSYSISSMGQSFSPGGGTGQVNVTSPGGCTWSASSGASWISVISGGSGTGNGAVNYSVSSNSGTDSRSGTLTIAGKTFTVNQSGVPCSYSVSPTGQSIGINGGLGFFTVLTSGGCSWTATSDASWITFPYGNSGTGSNWGFYSVSANTGPSRTGVLTIGTQTFTVTQQGQDCTFSLSTTSQSFVSDGGTGQVSVTSPGGCSWSASSDVGWISIVSGGSGSGNGTVSYAVSANSGTDSRSGTLTIAGKSFTVSQSGVACSYSISPVSQSLMANQGIGFFVVLTSSGCSWTATSEADWITFRYGNSGTGSNWVFYSVSANTGPSRTGIITIGSKPFTVTQQGQD